MLIYLIFAILLHLLHITYAIEEYPRGVILTGKLSREIQEQVKV